MNVDDRTGLALVVIVEDAGAFKYVHREESLDMIVSRRTQHVGG